MATIEEIIIAPAPAENELDRLGAVSAASIARRVWEDHVRQKRARRQLELMWEKYLLHIDGSGDSQWADIYYGQICEIPRLLSPYRKSENILRNLVRNAVAHHTAVPLQYFALASADREAREKALMDTLWANHLANEQDFNGLFALALALAMPAGFCPVHAYWRDDTAFDWYDPVAPAESGGLDMFTPGPGSIDTFVGNPWDTVFDPTARRGSWRWWSYVRLLPAEAVRRFFDHVPAARTLEGSTRLRSTSEFQRIARSWLVGSLGAHGRPLIEGGGALRDDEELITLCFREDAPGGPGDPGRLRIVAVPGEQASGWASEGRHVVLLADQPLPGGDVSGTVFYSDERGSDVHGRPWVEDKDDLQIDLNLALSKEWEMLVKQAEAPIITPAGAIPDEMAEIGGYKLIETEPALANWRPRVVEWPQYVVMALRAKIQDLRRQLYTLGGYQAVSRGEAPGSRTPYRAILALQQADRTIHAPVNQLFQRAAITFMQRCWKQFKAYGDVGWLVSVADIGAEYAHLAEPYIDKTKLSDRPPRYRLINSFGSSPELLMQEILQLVQTRGADGMPFLSTEEARRAWPHRIMFDQPGDPRAVQRRRARTIAAYAPTLARRYRELTGFDEAALPVAWRAQAIEQIGRQLAFAGIVIGTEIVEPGLEQRFPRLRDDDLDAHITAYTEITQDETADPLARAMLRARQELYFEWQAAMATQARGAQPEAAARETEAPAQPRPEPAGMNEPELVTLAGQ